MRTATLAMEYFVATPDNPLETALKNLRKCDLMILVIGFNAGSLLADCNESTYTSAEYDEALRLGMDILVFLKQESGQNGQHWRNDEQNSEKSAALDNFKKRVEERWTWDRFTTPTELALNVVLALDQWEARGRPGARKTFASTAEYFQGKNPAGQVQLLDFGTTRLGRDDQIRALDYFAGESTKRICMLSGRGGIGKSKILHDWANLHSDDVVFLKDEPLWHEDSEKEIPITCKVVIIDDAHKHESIGKVLQLLSDTSVHRKLKLIVSTRPGSLTPLSHEIYRKLDSSQVLQLPELEELTIQQSRALAEQVLGDDFRNFADHLAEISSNSPLVIVAGGRLIATRKIDPSTLTTLQDFRSTIFNRFLDDKDLRGSRFPIDPPFKMLNLIAALGPVDVESREFQEAARSLFDRHVDEI